MGRLREQQRHRRDQIVQPFIIVEGADEADRIGIVEPEAAGEGPVRGLRIAEQVEIDAVGRDDDLVRRDAARDQIARRPSQITATASAWRAAWVSSIRVRR